MTPVALEIDEFFVSGRSADVPVRRYRPVKQTTGTPLVWVHGGAFSGGGLDQLESHAVATSIAEHGREVVTLDYRLVPAWSWWRPPRSGVLPGIRFPLPLDDVADVFEQVVSEAGGPVVLGGASAGACLAAASALRAVSLKRTRPDRLVLAYGTFHAALPALSSEVRSRVKGRHGLVQFRSGTVEKMNRNYAGSIGAMDDPFAFPGGHDVAGLPRTYILDADRDTLRASGERFSQELTDSGVDVTRFVLPESTHGFLNRPGTSAYADGLGRLVSWLDATDSGRGAP